MRDYSKDFAEWRKWRDEKGLPPIYDNPADAGIETDFRVGQQVSFTNEYGVGVRTAHNNGILQTGAFGPVRLPRLRLLLVPDGTQIVKTLPEMKDIHHTCRCTGQQFTFKEWCAWLDNHEKAGQDSGKFVALSYNGFDFNIHDVCLTPNRPVRLFNHHCIVEVKTAQSPTGRWDYGLDVNLHNSGHHVGAGFVDDVQKGYPTEAAAILAALLDARKSAERELANCSGRSQSNLDNEDDEDGFIKDSTLARYIRNIIKQIDDQRRATAFKQLTLF